jgi:hypothetical protein
MERETESIKVKDILTLRATDKCLMRVPNMNVKVLENTHEMISRSRCGQSTWLTGMGYDWQNCMERLCCKVLQSSRSRANGTAGWELGRESRTCKMLCSTVKLWYRILLME